MCWIVDFEASGLSYDSYPIEVGLYNIYTKEEYSSLIKPYSSWTHWDHNAEHNIHHISREMLMSEGKDPQVVCAEMNSILDGRPVYSDNWQYDRSWFWVLFDDADVDTYTEVRSVYEIIKLESVPDFEKAMFRMPEHRALPDAKMIGNALMGKL